MALKYHPDKNLSNIENANEMMRKINEAYEYLSKMIATNKLRNSLCEFNEKRKSRIFKQKSDFQSKVFEIISKTLRMKNTKYNLRQKPILQRNLNTFFELFQKLNKNQIQNDDLNFLLNHIEKILISENSEILFYHFRNFNGIQLFDELFRRNYSNPEFLSYQKVFNQINDFGNRISYF